MPGVPHLAYFDGVAKLADAAKMVVVWMGVDEYPKAAVPKHIGRQSGHVYPFGLGVQVNVNQECPISVSIGHEHERACPLPDMKDRDPDENLLVCRP